MARALLRRHERRRNSRRFFSFFPISDVRAISALIATLILIGATVAAGAVVYTVMRGQMGALSSSPDVSVVEAKALVPSQGLDVPPKEFFSVQDDRSVLSLHFDEGSGNIAKDSSSNTNNGTLYNFNWNENSGWTSGVSGSALRFDGTNDYVIGSGVNLANSSYTIMYWSKRKSSKSLAAVSVGDAPEEYETVGLGYISDRLTALLWGHDLRTPSTYNDFNEWHMLAVTFDIGTGTRKLFYDGNLVANDVVAAFTGNDTFTIGHSTWSEYYDGTIDEIRIYDRALSRNEIWQHYSQYSRVLDLHFEEWTGTEAADLSLAANDGTFYGANDGALRTGGMYALSFDGTNDYVEASGALPQALPELTIEAWIKHPSDTEFRQIVNRSPDWFGAGAFKFTKSNGHKLWLDAWDLDPQGYVGTINVDDNEWHHAVVVVDASTVKFFVDGNLDVSRDITSGSIQASSGDIYIGARPSLDAQWFDGTIDEVRIYNRALSPEEIKFSYASGRGNYTPMNTYGLVLWLHFDEGSGTTVQDSSDYGNDGTVNGASWVAGEIAPSEPEWVNGRIGKALRFDGTDDYVEVPDSDSLDISDNITIAFWLKLNVLGDYLIFAKNNYTNYNYGVRIISPDNKIEFSFFDTTNVWRQTFSSELPWETGVWYYIAITYKSTEGTRFYRNGTFVNLYTITQTMRTNDLPLYIGRQSDESYLNGAIDEIRIYNRALSENEVKELYSSGSQRILRDSSLVGEWRFDEGTGGAALDTSHIVEGRDGLGKHFDGVDDYVKVPNSTSLQISNVISVEAWIWRDSSATGQWDFATKTVSWLFRLRHDPYCHPEIWLMLPSGWQRTWMGGSAIPYNEWHHLAFTYDETWTKVYVNGTKIGEDNAYTGPLQSSTEDILIGNLAKGKVDEVRIYNRALSENEIKQLYLLGARANLVSVTVKNTGTADIGPCSTQIYLNGAWAQVGHTDEIHKGATVTFENSQFTGLMAGQSYPARFATDDGSIVKSFTIIPNA